MNRLYRHEKVRLVLLGLVAPLFMVALTLYFLRSGEAFLPARAYMMPFYGWQAGVVSLLWFGLSICLFGCNFLALVCPPYKRESIISKSLWLGILLITVGACSAVWFVIASSR